MTKLLRRDRTTVADLVDWFENEVAMAPLLRRPLLNPPLRIEETLDEKTYTLRVEIPGIDPDRDVELTISEGILTVRAERQESKTEANRSEFHYGSFQRSVTLPTHANADKVAATYTDGILQVTVPLSKAEKPETTKVAITKG
ncbi:MAG TPA: Hsp20/alpha crystallin family protein [Sporichthya sp.]|nr:Hsp20/alpha crystallin family protein [Sporichthya sp.]